MMKSFLALMFVVFAMSMGEHVDTFERHLHSRRVHASHGR